MCGAERGSGAFQQPFGGPELCGVDACRNDDGSVVGQVVDGEVIKHIQTVMPGWKRLREEAQKELAVIARHMRPFEIT